MSFPVAISDPASGQIPLNGVPGPLVFGSDRYVVLQDEFALDLLMYKSVDGGFTWAVVDGANSPSSSGSNYAACSDGTKIWVATLDATGYSVQVTDFTPGADTWGTTTVTTNTTTGALRIICIVFDQSSGNLAVSLEVEAFRVLPNGTRPGYFTINPTSRAFSGWTQLGPVLPNTVILECDAALYAWGAVQFILWAHDPNNPGGTRTLYVQALGGSPNVIDSVFDSGTTLCTPAAGSDGTNLFVAWIPTDAAPLSINTFLSTAPLTWSAQTITATPLGLSDAINGLGAILNGAAAIAFIQSYNFDTQNELFYASDADDFATLNDLGPVDFRGGGDEFYVAPVPSGFASTWVVSSGVGTDYYETALAPAPPAVASNPIQKTIVRLPGKYCCETKCANGFVIGKMVLYKRKK